ncbi:MAG TPA: hypothetical protein VFE25_07575 [Opitutaceae bacterium]|nr:hypothetical protein [Opitutaceae bacterium]
MAERRRQCLLLIAILVASTLLRFLLCARGGQYFLNDEQRYDRGISLYVAALNGDTAHAREVLALPEHPLFPWLGAAVTAMQRPFASLVGRGDWGHHPENIAFSIWIGACLLSLFSSLNILLVALVARRLGAGWGEALWSALLMAVSNTALYYSRHLVPYDAAICAGLTSLLLGLGGRSNARVFLSGILACSVFLLYNGYWFLPPVVGLLFLRSWKGDPDIRAKAVAFALGGAAIAAAVFLIGTWAGGGEYWRIMGAFSHTVTQGLFSEGWSLPWEYFWNSEGCLGAVVVALIACAWVSSSRLGRPRASRLVFGLAGAALVYALLVVFSVGLNFFVVYGRTVKPIVPFLCIAGGCALAQLLGERRTIRILVATGFVAGGILMAVPHFTFIFPREVEVYVLRNFGNPKRTLSVSGSIYIPLAVPVGRPDLALVNDQILYPIKDFIGYPEGRTLFSVENVLDYRPFQYEGHTPRQRKILRDRDISVRLILLAHPETVPNDLPFALRNQTRPDGRGS